jgi:periplasmic mercuric ion binding protein
MRFLTLFAGLALAALAFGADFSRIQLSVPGMDCELCPVTVRKALEKTAGVKSARVDLASKTATVEYDPHITSPRKLTAATERAGYPSTVKGGN